MCYHVRHAHKISENLGQTCLDFDRDKGTMCWYISHALSVNCVFTSADDVLCPCGRLSCDVSNTASVSGSCSQVLTVFFASFIAGSLLNQIETIIHNPTSLVTILGDAAPQVAVFFMTYLLLMVSHGCWTFDMSPANCPAVRHIKPCTFLQTLSCLAACECLCLYQQLSFVHDTLA